MDWKIPEQALRQGNPTTVDVILGTALVALVLEIARRSLGFVLPLIIMVFIAYALLGPQMPFQILKHPGVDWRQFINNMYFPSEGIFRGDTVGGVNSGVSLCFIRCGCTAHGSGSVLCR